MKMTVQPAGNAERADDVTRQFVAAIAQELERSYGGSATEHWREAELHVQRLMEHNAHLSTVPALVLEAYVNAALMQASLKRSAPARRYARADVSASRTRTDARAGSHAP